MAANAVFATHAGHFRRQCLKHSPPQHHICHIKDAAAMSASTASVLPYRPLPRDAHGLSSPPPFPAADSSPFIRATIFSIYSKLARLAFSPDGTPSYLGGRQRRRDYATIGRAIKYVGTFHGRRRQRHQTSTCHAAVVGPMRAAD